MANHPSSSALLSTSHFRPREEIHRDLFKVRDTLGDSGKVKRFERFISPHLGTITPPTEDFLDGLIQRNSWLR